MEHNFKITIIWLEDVNEQFGLHKSEVLTVT